MLETFESMGLNGSLVEALKIADITLPTEIQQKVIPVAGKNGDLIFQSETGTGKTLAYLLPLFEKLETDRKEMQALILVPTHELAIQVIRQIEMLSLNSDIKATSTPIIGDVNITRQVDKLRTKPHIIVGTAGRILELIQKKKISAHTVKTIIIDEADRLLDDNNIEGIKSVIKTTLKERQILMCSASMSARTIERARQLMKEPEIVKSTTAIEVPDTIDHIYFVAEKRDKIDVLRKLVRMLNPPKAIAFFANAEDIAEAAEKLRFHKLRADGLHGSNIKSDRKKTMDDFKSGKLQLLIASDIAARGLDIEGVTHIFNVNIPERSMDYLHRAGRTGRNGNAGVSISIAAENEIPFIRQFEKELRISIIPKSMYNGVIVEYRKEKKKFDTTSEYGTNPRKKKLDGQEDEKPQERNKYGKAESRYKKADGSEPKFNRDKSGKPFEKKYTHDKDGRPESRFKKADGSEPRFNGDRKKPESGGTAARFRRDGDKPQERKKYDRADRDGKPFEKNFDRDKSGKPFEKKFSRDKSGKPENRFKKDESRSGKAVNGRPAKAPGNKPNRKDGDRPGKAFGSKPGKAPGGKPGRTVGGKPTTGRKPWDRKPQASNKSQRPGGK